MTPSHSVLGAAFWMAACGATPEPTNTPPTNAAPLTPTPSAGRSGFTAEGCPVPDTAFCARGTQAATALVAGDVSTLMGLTWEETFVCDEVPANMVTGCASGKVLKGYAVFDGAAGNMRVYDANAYRQQLTQLLDRVDPAFSDARGGGAVNVLGVGTCGPADPTRRSYHVAFTAALRGDGAAASERWLGSLEFVMRDGNWVFALMYLGSVADWMKQYGDPFTQFACGNVKPWA
jgi:hypothetical protein